ncbi:hypothetical protein ACOMHN_011149 [Nucella lapillus]
MGGRVVLWGWGWGWLLHVTFLLHHLSVCQGSVYMTVSPYPARIYENAPPGVPVLTVQAYDNATGEAITDFRLEDRGLADYFAVNSSGILSTARQVDRIIGFQFKFFVFAVSMTAGNVQTEWKHVIIDVGEKNLYPPQFTKPSYDFSVYRFASPGTLIGKVPATDQDKDPHNRHFTIYAPPRQLATKYVNVTSSGGILLARSPPEAMTLLELLVLAVDDGSPQRTGTTTAVIVVDDVNKPSTFCLSTTERDTTLCWKNPMPGRRDQGYNIVVEGQGLVLHKHVKGDANADEFCVSISDLKLGQNYTFRVTLDDDDSAAPPGVELSFSKLGQGFSRGCTDEEFNACNFLSPCENGAKCEGGVGRVADYTCDCPSGWQGKNCTEEDLCPTQPCQNKAACLFTGHGQYKCQCPSDYFGKNCQNYDLCVATSPCQNGAICRMHDNGAYSCACPDYFSGLHCNVPDPCSPSPCGERGICVKKSDKMASCVCHSGFRGDRCEEVDACQTSPFTCANGGICKPAANGAYTCTCPPLFTGMTCQTFNACTLACKNNATCAMSEDGRYNCTCPPSYHGLECQYYNRCHGEPCKNGTCNRNEALPLCHCDPGFSGPVCDQYNPCLTGPCGGHGKCMLLPPSGPLEDGDLPYECECHRGWWGLQCQFPDRCHLGTCQNGAICRNTPSKNYKCDCISSHHYGDHCEYTDPCYSNPCLNAGHCRNLTNTQYNCTCLPGYAGERCQHETSCTRLPCANGATCEEVGDAGTVRCACAEGYLGYYCQLKDPCFDGHGGERQACGEHGRCESVNRTLVIDLDKAVGEVDFLFRCQCDERYSGKRCDVALASCDDVRCLNNGDCLHGVCVCPPGFTGSQCETAVSRCREEENTCGEGFRCVDTGTTYTCVCGNGGRLPDCKPVCRPEDMVSDKTGRYVWPETTAGHSAELTCPYGPQTNQSNSATRPCLLQGVWGEVDDSSCNELGLLAVSRLLNALKELTSHPASLGTSEVQNYTSILEVLYGYTLLDHEVASLLMNVVSNLADVNVSITVASNEENNTSERLLNLLNQYTADVNLSSQSNVSIMTPNFEVIAVSVLNTSSALTYHPSVETGNSSTEETQSNYTCVFWDPANRSWSTEGVVTVTKSGNFTVCHSLHLTSFAVLLDPSPHYILSSTHEAVLTYISYIGCAVSLFCLVLTIITYALFRSLNKDKSGKILLHLCVALLLLNAVFLASGLASSADNNSHDLDDDATSCTAVAALLHYLLLAALLWMLVEAVEMYRALVTVFAKYSQCYMIKRCLVGWGLPLVIVGITLAVDTDNYDTDGAFCFISRSSPAAYYGSLVMPACVVLLVNTVIFILVARVILKPRFQQQQKQKGVEGITPAQVRGAFTVMFLLGVTWVFGPLAIREAKVVFNYLFCILNSLQGFLIFVFRCLFNPEVRMCWVQLVKTGTLKKRRGPIRSNVYSDTCSKADGKSGTFHDGSHGTGSNGSSATTKTSLRTSNGWHPKLNGFSGSGGSQIMERRGTKFSTLEFSQDTPESMKKGQKSPLTEDERYGDGNLDHVDDPVLDYYETGHDGSGDKARPVSYEDFHGDGGVLEYYESIRSSRKEDSGGEGADSQEGGPLTRDEDDSDDKARSGKQSPEIKTDSDELTYL